MRKLHENVWTGAVLLRGGGQKEGSPGVPKVYLHISHVLIGQEQNHQMVSFERSFIVNFDKYELFINTLRNG